MEERLMAIGPVDGRYARKTHELRNYFSEHALFFYRVKVELAYLKKLLQTLKPTLVSESLTTLFETILEAFSLEDSLKIKEIEKVTNHDVKAVEYYIKNILKEKGFDDIVEWVHFGLTSNDINNTAIPLSMLEFHKNILSSSISTLTKTLDALAVQWKDIPLLAHTHGQPASPTRLGKEFQVFSTRLKEQIDQLENLPFCAKFGGATGNFNAHFLCFEDIDWHQWADDFLKDLGLRRSFPTTQIEHYDYLAAYFDTHRRTNNILIDFSRDVWTYIGMNYFHQKAIKNEVGSSAMPHKVNPIDFENAEGNLGMANSVLYFLSSKLPISRLQRDLTDSTVLRNIGIPFGHMEIAYQSLIKGMSKLELNENRISADLEENWAVVAEGIQNVLRTKGVKNPYELLKELTRGKGKIGQKDIHQFIESLDIDLETKNKLKRITPFNYIGK
ncbi:MAG: adenylosuccinate lyase [Bacteroidota bacterium]|nr:adenylosuccinate lyase [Bacteroidota bacterium]